MWSRKEVFTWQKYIYPGITIPAYEAQKLIVENKPICETCFAWLVKPASCFSMCTRRLHCFSTSLSTLVLFMLWFLSLLRRIVGDTFNFITVLHSKIGWLQCNLQRLVRSLLYLHISDGLRIGSGHSYLTSDWFKLLQYFCSRVFMSRRIFAPLLKC